MSDPDAIAPEPLNELEFSRQVEAVRPALRGYLLSLVPDRSLADEVFQDTLLFLWRERARFVPGTGFRAWAFRCGYFSALAKKRDRSREKAVSYPDEFFHRVAEHAERHADRAESRLAALRECLARLEASDRSLLERRYGADAERFSRSEPDRAGRLYKALSRLRLRLKLCVEKRLKDHP